MHILVTGANGFVGSRLVPALVRLGMQIRSLILPGTGSAGLEGSEVFAGEMNEPNLVRALNGVGIVVNLAGNMTGARKDRYFSANAGSVENLMKAIAGMPEVPRLLQVSSVAAMGPSSSGIPLDEEAECSPVSLYGRTKLIGERTVSKYRGRIRINLLRPCSLYGPGDKSFHGIFRFAEKGRFFRFCTREKVFNLLYIDDFIDIIVKLIRNPVEHFVMNVGNPEEVTADSFENELMRANGVSGGVVFLPPGMAKLLGKLYDLGETATGVGDIMSSNKIMEFSHPRWLQDFSRFRRTFPDMQFTPFREGVSKTWRWYKDNGWI